MFAGTRRLAAHVQIVAELVKVAYPQFDPRVTGIRRWKTMSKLDLAVLHCSFHERSREAMIEFAVLRLHSMGGFPFPPFRGCGLYADVLPMCHLVVELIDVSSSRSKQNLMLVDAKDATTTRLQVRRLLLILRTLPNVSSSSLSTPTR
jgi:hypothetical protein